MTDYDRIIAQTVNNYVSDTGNDIKVYAISFSKSTTLYNHIRSVATTAGASSANVYPYSDDRDLGAIFDAIRQDILNDLWVVNGPA